MRFCGQEPWVSFMYIDEIVAANVGRRNYQLVKQSDLTLIHDFNLGLAHPQPQPSQVEFMYGANRNS